MTLLKRKMKKSKKQRFENPVETILDISRFLSREIGFAEAYEIIEDDRICGYSFRSRAFGLTVRMETHFEGTEVQETLTVKKEWDTGEIEKITYKNQFTDQSAWIIDEFLGTLKTFGADREFLSSQCDDEQLKDELDKTDTLEFARRIDYIQIPTSQVYYEASSAARVVETLASLRMMSISEDRGEALLWSIFEDLLCLEPDLDAEVKRKTGRCGEREILRFVRNGGSLSCKAPFSWSQDEDLIVPAPWEFAYVLVDLCKYYCKALPRGRHANY